MLIITVDHIVALQKKKKLLYGLYILKFDCYFRKNKSKNNKLLVFGNHLCNKRKVVMVLELAKS